MPVQLMKGKSSSSRWEGASDSGKNGDCFNERTCLAGRPTDGRFASIAVAQGRIAVVNLEQAILQTDVAQQRLQEFEEQRGLRL